MTVPLNTGLQYWFKGLPQNVITTGDTGDVKYWFRGLPVNYAKAATLSGSLVGVAATGGVGSLSISESISLTGVESTTAAGTVTAFAEFDVSITGVEATSGVGTLALDISPALTGVEATGAAGLIIFPANLTGVASVGAAGSLSFPRLALLVGVAATGAVGTFASVRAQVPLFFRVGAF